MQGYGEKGARYVLLQPVDDHDLKEMAQEAACIQAHTAVPFLLAPVPVQDWNKDLSPWPAPPVFGKEGFGDGAGKLLEGLLNQVLPALWQEYALPEDGKLLIGGYSLAGLFALWAGYESEAFDGVAAASPSVWFPGFLDYALARPLGARAVYLSLGDREERTKNPVMGRVGDCIRTLHNHYQDTPSLSTTLEWNPGNHFQDPGLRTGKAFAWTLNRLEAEAPSMK